jgi:hypothetical protein
MSLTQTVGHTQEASVFWLRDELTQLRHSFFKCEEVKMSFISVLYKGFILSIFLMFNRRN